MDVQNPGATNPASAAETVLAGLALLVGIVIRLGIALFYTRLKNVKHKWPYVSATLCYRAPPGDPVLTQGAETTRSRSTNMAPASPRESAHDALVVAIVTSVSAQVAAVSIINHNPRRIAHPQLNPPLALKNHAAITYHTPYGPTIYRKPQKKSPNIVPTSLSRFLQLYPQHTTSRSVKPYLHTHTFPLSDISQLPLPSSLGVRSSNGLGRFNMAHDMATTIDAAEKGKQAEFSIRQWLKALLTWKKCLIMFILIGVLVANLTVVFVEAKQRHDAGKKELEAYSSESQSKGSGQFLI
ncbi:MAG: hypothetical protein Q9203_006582 [Teloschistes exilis]